MTGPARDLHCAAAVTLVNDLIEGVLPPAEQLEVELHMVVCNGCNAVVDQMRTTVALLGSLPEPSLSRGAAAELRTATAPLLTTLGSRTGDS